MLESSTLICALVGSENDLSDSNTRLPNSDKEEFLGKFFYWSNYLIWNDDFIITARYNVHRAISRQSTCHQSSFITSANIHSLHDGASNRTNLKLNFTSLTLKKKIPQMLKGQLKSFGVPCGSTRLFCAFTLPMVERSYNLTNSVVLWPYLVVPVSLSRGRPLFLFLFTVNAYLPERLASTHLLSPKL